MIRVEKVGVSVEESKIGVKFTRVLEYFFRHAFACLFVLGTSQS